jgi:hypothetical protein
MVSYPNGLMIQPKAVIDLAKLNDGPLVLFEGDLECRKLKFGVEWK